MIEVNKIKCNNNGEADKSSEILKLTLDKVLKTTYSSCHHNMLLLPLQQQQQPLTLFIQSKKRLSFVLRLKPVKKVILTLLK